MYFRLCFAALLLGSVTLSLAGEPVALRDGLWRDQHINYVVKANGAFYQGDMLLDRVTDGAARTREKSTESNVISSPSYRWPGGVVPYELDPQLSSENLAAIQDGIKIINAVQAVTMQPRNGEDNFVRFINDDGCYSNVGMVGGAQPISMGTGCESSGTAVHEILHALGGFHDQSRTDRDQYIKVRLDNIDKVNANNFDISKQGQDVGFYDYSSLSHYGPRDFTRNGKAAIETIPAGIPIGLDAQGLSPDDIYAVRFMYGKTTKGVTITSQPRGQSIVVDGTAITTPATYDWAQGTQHTLQVPLPQSKDASARLVAGRWSDDTDPAVKLGDSRTIVVDKTDAIYGYNFVQQFQVSAVVAAAGGGAASITPASADGYYTAGTEISAKAEPSGTKTFLGWTGRGPFGTIGQASNPISYVVTGSTQLKANFGDAPATVIASIPPGRAVTVDGEVTVTPAPFVWQPGSKHTISVDAAPQMQFDKILRHVFTGWSDSGAGTHEITANGQTVTANFTSQYKLITMADPPNGGTINASPAATDGWYDQGTTVQITAVPAAGAQFAQFRGDLTGANPSGAVIMNDQMLVTGSFAAAAGASTEGHKATH